MERDLAAHRYSSSFVPGCLPSSPCFQRPEDYSRLRICSGSNRSRRLRNIIKRIVREGKSIYGSKPLTFQYDAVSYSRNFDDGCHKRSTGTANKCYGTSDEVCQSDYGCFCSDISDIS